MCGVLGVKGCQSCFRESWVGGGRFWVKGTEEGSRSRALPLGIIRPHFSGEGELDLAAHLAEEKGRERNTEEEIFEKEPFRSYNRIQLHHYRWPGWCVVLHFKTHRRNSSCPVGRIPSHRGRG